MGIITSDERWRAVRKSFYADFWPNCIVDNVTTNEEAVHFVPLNPYKTRVVKFSGPLKYNGKKYHLTHYYAMDRSGSKSILDGPITKDFEEFRKVVNEEVCSEITYKISWPKRIYKVKPRPHKWKTPIPNFEQAIFDAAERMAKKHEHQYWDDLAKKCSINIKFSNCNFYADIEYQDYAIAMERDEREKEKHENTLFIIHGIAIDERTAFPLRMKIKNLIPEVDCQSLIELEKLAHKLAVYHKDKFTRAKQDYDNMPLTYWNDLMQNSKIEKLECIGPTTSNIHNQQWFERENKPSEAMIYEIELTYKGCDQEPYNVEFSYSNFSCAGYVGPIYYILTIKNRMPLFCYYRIKIDTYALIKRIKDQLEPKKEEYLKRKDEEAKRKLLAEQKRLLKQAKRNKKAKKPLPVIQENSTGLECPVCFAQNANYVNMQCQHLMCCADCLNAIKKHGKCPKCRAELTQTLKIYV